jgi:hypothetical protein
MAALVGLRGSSEHKIARPSKKVPRLAETMFQRYMLNPTDQPKCKKKNL